MFHYMFSMTFKLVQPQFAPVYTVGLFQPRAMASSSPTTSIPIQEPVFLQFLHDVHHAYLLLHRAMALLPPTLIPNIEPTPLPSTDVWNQPEGLRPIYSDQTNAFIDAVHLPNTSRHGTVPARLYPIGTSKMGAPRHCNERAEGEKKTDSCYGSKARSKRQKANQTTRRLTRGSWLPCQKRPELRWKGSNHEAEREKITPM